MFAARRSHVIIGLVGTGMGIGLAATVNRAQAESTSGMLNDILAGVRRIEGDLGTSGGSAGDIDPVSNFPTLTDKHTSLMAQTLKERPDLYSKYCNVRTENGFTFEEAIIAGIEGPHLGCGCTASEEDSYRAFKEFFDVVIEKYHGFKPTDSHQSDLDASHLNWTSEQQALFDKHVVSTRVRAGRSVRGLPLPPGTNRAQRRTVERLLSTALRRMDGDLAGIYYPLGGMTKQQEQQLIDDHFLFQKPSARNVLSNCGAARDWPDGRGIFHNNNKTFLVWVNEEDHMRVIAMQMGGNVREVFERWSRGVQEVEKSLNAEGYEYSHNDHHGYITTCPTNLGTGLRASVMLKLPKVYKAWGVERLEEYCKNLGLQARGSKGEHTPPGPNGEFDISNRARIGQSEVQLVQTMIDGVNKLISIEEGL